MLVNADGEQMCRLAIDPQSHKLVSKTYWGMGMMGSEGQIQETYAQLTTVGGIELPMKTVRTLDGQKMATIEFSEYDVNVAAPEELFTRPE